MKHYKEILCPSCKHSDIQKNGKTQKGIQKYRCKSCKRTFQTDYKNKAWQEGMKDKIDAQILNSSGVRETARVLGINKNTVISHLKKKPQNK